MAAATQNSPDLLCGEILAAAHRESEAIRARAQAETATIIAEAEAAAKKIHQDRMTQAQADAARRRELILATVTVETGRLRSARIEALLESVHEEIRRGVQAQDSGRHETIVELAAEAIRRMPGNSFMLGISAADHAALGDALAVEIFQRCGRSPLRVTISGDPCVTSGVMIRDADGFQHWDNRLLPRLERLWPQLRRQIASQALPVNENHPTGGNA